MKLNLVITILLVFCVSLAIGKPIQDSDTVETNLKIIINAYRIIRDLRARSNETDERHEDAKRQLINKLQFIQDEKISSVRKKLEPLKIASQLKLDRIYKVENVLAIVEEKTKSGSITKPTSRSEVSSSLKTLSAPRKEILESNSQESSRNPRTYKFVPYDESDKMPYQLNIDLSDRLDSSKSVKSNENGESKNNNVLASAYMHLEQIDTLEEQQPSFHFPVVNTQSLSQSKDLLPIENTQIHQVIQHTTSQEPNTTPMPISSTTNNSILLTTLADNEATTPTQDNGAIEYTIQNSTERSNTKPTEVDIFDDKLSSLLNKDLIDELEKVNKKDLDLLLVH